MNQSLDVSAAELQSAIGHSRSGKPPRLTVSSTGELFEAVRLGIIEVCELLGCQAKRWHAAAALRRNNRERFTKRSPGNA